MSGTRLVKAVHGLRDSPPDPQFELELAADKRERLTSEQLIEVYARFAGGAGYIDLLMWRTCLRAPEVTVGRGSIVGPGRW